MDTLFYKIVHVSTLPSPGNLLEWFPEGDIISVKQTVPLLGAEPEVGYVKLVFQSEGHRYTFLNRGIDPATDLYTVELSVSPSRHNRSVHPEDLVAECVSKVIA